MKFIHSKDSHHHSLQTLDQLYRYDDFMYSIRSMVDLGCGNGDDLIWWATRTTRDDTPVPLNIRCTGIDLAPKLSIINSHLNASYVSQNFEDPIIPHPGGFDVLWCHDAFQYAINPIKTLSQWWHMTSEGGMLALIVPVTQSIHHRQVSYVLSSGCYYHHTMVSLIYMLATSGWSCSQGFFKQDPTEPWINAVVYKSNIEPMLPHETTWHRLSELGLLPDSAKASVYAHNALRQQDLVVPWIDHSFRSMAL
jgi:SAM-dependent methyltransferase